MQHIHNNPKLKAPRMPVMLAKGLENAWLHPIMDYADKKGIKELIARLPDGELAAYPVATARKGIPRECGGCFKRSILRSP
jgi:putative SOS response-associated peptidase YedK